MKGAEHNHHATSFALTGLIEYEINSIISKTIVEKLTGTVRLYAVDSGQAFAEATSVFDAFIQILEGSARVIVDLHATNVHVGQAIIIPAHTRSSIVSEIRFKMLSTVIKSGYEDESLT